MYYERGLFKRLEQGQERQHAEWNLSLLFRHASDMADCAYCTSVKKMLLFLVVEIKLNNLFGTISQKNKQFVFTRIVSVLRFSTGCYVTLRRTRNYSPPVQAVNFFLWESVSPGRKQRSTFNVASWPTRKTSWSADHCLHYLFPKKKSEKRLLWKTTIKPLSLRKTTMDKVCCQAKVGEYRMWQL